MTVEKINDHLLALFVEWQRLREGQENMRGDETPEAWMMHRGRRCMEIEKQMSRYVPLSPEGAAALVQVMLYWAKYETSPSDDQQERMLANLLAWIEGVGEAA